MQEFKTPLKQRLASQKWHNNNPDYGRNYYKLHTEECKNYIKKYNKNNPDKVKALWNKRNPKRILFKNIRVTLEKNPRTGICSKCNYIGFTCMHHDEYDESNPLAHTREMCASCHRKYHWSKK